MYARMLVELKTYAAALDNAIKALIGLQALTPHKGRPSKEVINYRTQMNYKIQTAAHKEEMASAVRSMDNFSIVDPGFKPPRKKSKFSVATRKRMAAAQKKRWAQAKKGNTQIGRKAVIRGGKKLLTMKAKKKVA